MSVIPFRRSSLAAAIPPSPAPTMMTSRLRCGGADGWVAGADIRLILLNVVCCAINLMR
jgi:hypothetical protein